MAITFPRALPDVPIKSIRMGLNVNQSFFESGLSRQTTVQGHAGGATDRWEGLLTTATLSKVQVQELSAWLTSLRGQEGTFQVYDPDRTSPKGVASTSTSTPKVNGAGQVGRNIIVDGWLPNTNGLLEPGDYIQIGDQYFMIMETLSSGASGNKSLSIEPAIRTSPADNTTVIFENPVLIARMADKNQSWETDALALGSYSFAWEEVV